MTNVYVVLSKDHDLPPAFSLFDNLDAAQACASKFPFLTVVEWPVRSHYPEHGGPAEVRPTLVTPASVHRLDVKSGEALVVTLPDDVALKDFDEVTAAFRRAFEDALPGVKVIMSNRAVDLTVVAGEDDGQ